MFGSLKAIMERTANPLPSTEEGEGNNNEKAAAVTSGDGTEQASQEDGIWTPADMDVLSGRGAAVNAHNGNKKFRALCFSRKAVFDAGNHGAKRKIAQEIVDYATATWGSRFLKRKDEKGPWHVQTKEQACLKACQVIRDYKRPDRILQREKSPGPGGVKKRNRATATPVLDDSLPPPPKEPPNDNPAGVHDHDVLSGRGAFVNGHVGNERLRKMAQAHKTQFDAGTFTEKRNLATEIVSQIKSLNPPGRFLRKVDPSKPGKVDESGQPPKTLEGGWEELSNEKTIHKVCQIMRDIDRSDRKDREGKRRHRRISKDGKPPTEAADVSGMQEAVDEAVDKALEAVENKKPPSIVGEVNQAATI